MVTVKHEVPGQAGPSTMLPIRAHEDGNEEQTRLPRGEQFSASGLPSIQFVSQPHVPTQQSSRLEQSAGGLELGSGVGSILHAEHSSSGRLDMSMGSEMTPVQMQAAHEKQIEACRQQMLLMQQVDEQVKTGSTGGMPKTHPAPSAGIYPTHHLSMGRSDMTPAQFQTACENARMLPSLQQVSIEQQMAVYKQQMMEKHQSAREAMTGGALGTGLSGFDSSATSPFVMSRLHMTPEQKMKAVQDNHAALETQHRKMKEASKIKDEYSMADLAKMQSKRSDGSSNSRDFPAQQREPKLSEPQNMSDVKSIGDVVPRQVPARNRALDDYQQQLDALELNRKTRLQTRSDIPFVNPKDEPPLQEYQSQLLEVEEMAKLAQDQAPKPSVPSTKKMHSIAASAQFKKRRLAQLAKESQVRNSQAQKSQVNNSPDYCNPGSPPVFGNSQGGVPLNTQPGYANQDYHMQLMLLEQQNKKRLMMARQEQDRMIAEGQANRAARFKQPRLELQQLDASKQSQEAENHTDNGSEKQISFLGEYQQGQYVKHLEKSQKAAFDAKANDEATGPQRKDQANGFPVYYEQYAAGMSQRGVVLNTNTGHALQDYGMQMMLLEQENKRQLAKLRQNEGAAKIVPGESPVKHDVASYEVQLLLLQEQNKKRVLLARQEQQIYAKSREGQAASEQSAVEVVDFRLTLEEKAHILQRRKQQSEELPAKTTVTRRDPAKLALDDYEWVSALPLEILTFLDL